MKSAHTNKNIYDYFIILVISSTIIGTAQIGLISHAFVVGLLCLPFTLLEIVSSFQKGKMQPIILFMVIWILYTLISITWAPKHEHLLREIWILLWNIIIFIGLYHASKKANTASQSFLEIINDPNSIYLSLIHVLIVNAYFKPFSYVSTE